MKIILSRKRNSTYKGKITKNRTNLPDRRWSANNYGYGIHSKEKQIKFSEVAAAIQNTDVDRLKKIMEKCELGEVQLRDPQLKRSVLHVAAKWGDWAIWETLLDHLDEIAGLMERTDESGFTPLIVAVRQDNGEAVSALLKAGADYKNKNTYTGRNILHEAIVAGKHSLLKTLTETFPDENFIRSTDINGDSPVMLAVRLCDAAALEILFGAPTPGIPTGTSPVSGDSCLRLAVEAERADLVEMLLAADPGRGAVDAVDSRGDTPLLLAVRTRCGPCVDRLLRHRPGPDLLHRNAAGETVLHAAAYADDPDVLTSVIRTSGVRKILGELNYAGQTAYEVALGGAGPATVLAFHRTGAVDGKFLNANGETSLFVAAKNGNYRVVQNLLLSDSYYAGIDGDPDKSTARLRRCEIAGAIYSSDVFVLAGLETSGRGWATSPDQRHLFRRNAEGQNVFHACAFSETLECAVFLYKYCRLFNEAWRHLDRPDNGGNTPLAFAVRCGNERLAEYLILNGADLAKRNSAGVCPLEAMAGHFHGYRATLGRVIDECVEWNGSGHCFDGKQLLLSCSLLCPPGRRQTEVLALIFTKLYRPENFGILVNPVLEYFTELKWSRLYRLILLRFAVCVLTALFFSLYLTCTLCQLLAPSPAVTGTLWYITMFLSVVSFLMTVPCMFARAEFGYRRVAFITAVAAYPALIITFLLFEPRNRWTLEVGALAVFLSWFSLLVYGNVTRMSYQVAMFCRVLDAILGHIFVALIVLFGFAFSFFVLFHDHFNFNNPYHSWLYTSVVMLMGGMEDNPIFSPELREEDEEKDVGRRVGRQSTKRLNTGLEMQETIIDGCFMLAYLVLVSMCLVNMMVGLAVRGGTELEMEGQITRTKTLVGIIHEWEHFIDSKLYEFLSRLGLSWLIGVPGGMRERMKVPERHYPLFQSAPCKFYSQSLKSIALKRSSMKIASFRPLLQDNERSSEENGSSKIEPGSPIHRISISP